MSPRAPWLDAREETPLQRAALLPLDLAALFYGAGAALHRLVYRRGLRAQRRLSCRVIAVGSPLVGGSGKTPTAAWIAASLRRRGRKVVIASRGYGRASRDPVVVVSDGAHVLAPSRVAGDEPLVLAAHARGVPVLVGRDRAIVGLRAVSAFGADVLVLDDGFQHHRLARDLDVVVLDGRFGLGNGRILPRGPLREPLGALRHAGAIGVIDGPLPEADAQRVAKLAPQALRFAARRRPRGVRPLAGGPEAPPESLAGLEVGVLAGIARPEGLTRTVEALGARVVAQRTFADHHAYRPGDVEDLARHAPVWVTTEKDAVKIVATWIRGADVRVLAIELDVEDPERVLDAFESRLR